MLEHNSSAFAEAEWLTLESVLCCYARDFARGVRTKERPRHRAKLAAALGDAPAGWLRLPFDASGVDVYAGLAHFSASGRHRLAAPIVLRERAAGAITPLTSSAQALRLVEEEHRAGFGPVSERTRLRLADSRDNLAEILAGARRIDHARLDFLTAEQSLVTGHTAHPLAKSRWGFTPAESIGYAPEHGLGFRLHYLLAHPDVALADEVAGGWSGLLRQDLEAHLATPETVRRLLVQRPDWTLIPLHPWEARWLRQRSDVRASLARGQLVWLGEAGAPWFATSSVRTVYRPDLAVQLKLSLHVAITNSARTNHLHELQRGVAVARLLESAWGHELARICPRFDFLRDVGYVAVGAPGAMVEGTGTGLRAADFPAHEKLALVAALAEPPRRGHSLLASAVSATSRATDLSPRAAAALWLDRYLELLTGSVFPAYEQMGLALEIHQQNLLVTLGEHGLPTRLTFRDNQGYFFRAGKAAEVLRHVPELADAGPCFVPEAELHEPFAYYLLVNNVLGLCEAFSSQGLLPEAVSLDLLEQRLDAQLAGDSTGFVRGLLGARTWPVKANLRMAIDDRDEATRPMSSPATYVPMANPLLGPAASIVDPPAQRVLHVARYPELPGPITLRAFDMARDFPVVHAWVNQAYCQKFWDMGGPIEDLEAFYLELLGSGHAHALVGEIAGKPVFVAETYWAPREPMAACYDARPGDHGLHMLTCPPEDRPASLPRRAFQICLEYFFAEPRVERVVGEPDARNKAVDKVIRSVGYVVAGTLELPEKTAHLIVCTRASFLAACPDSRPATSRGALEHLT